MSKLINLLDNLGEPQTKALGFGSHPRKPPTPTMALIVASTVATPNPQGLQHVDAHIMPRSIKGRISKPSRKIKGPDIVTGLAVGQVAPNDMIQLVDLGYDFVVIDSTDTSVAALTNDSLGKILLINSTVTESSARAVSSLPIDAVVLRPELTFPLSINSLISLAAIRGEIQKHFLLYIENSIEEWEVECLREIGIDGLVIEWGSSTNQETVSRIAGYIRTLPKRKSRAEKLSPSLPSPHSHNQPFDEEDEEEMDLMDDFS